MWEPDFTLLAAPTRIPTPEIGAWLPEHPPPPPPDPPPKRRKPESDTNVSSVMPYTERSVVRPKPFDNRSPFRHAGLMRDIGGVQAFMNVMRGTHRFPEAWDDG